MHYHHAEDEDGELVDLVPFCSAACLHQWREDHGTPCGGWSSCEEGGDSPEFCAQCGVYAGGGYECEHQRDNVVVNRFLSESGERCECGNWLQVPTSYL